jgi:hypothetical protein
VDYFNGDAMTDKTRYEKFMEDANSDVERFKSDAHAEGIYKFTADIKLIEKLQYHINQRIVIDLFGKQLGEHLWDKFVEKHGRNLLSWLSKLTEEYRLFILYELKMGRICL